MKVQVNSRSGALEKVADPKKLLAAALLEEAAAKAPEGFQHIVHATEFDNISTIDDPKTKLKTFHAKGKGTLQVLNVKKDALYPKKKCTFDMVAEESKDDMGLPDVKVTSLKIVEKE